MKKFLIRYILLLAFLMLSCINTNFAQPGIGISFRFSQLATTTAFNATGVTTVAFPAGNQDDNALLAAPAGMNLKFAGNNYQKIVVSTNGWFALVPASVVAVPASLSAGTFLSTNSLSTYAGGYPIIAPFWDDLACTSFQYNWVGNVLWVRWAAKIDKNNTTAAFLFWVRMDGTTGAIDFDYTSAAYTITGLPSASIGLAGVCTGDYYSYNSTLAPAFADSTMETSDISAKPINTTYTFTPYQLYDNCANAQDLSPLTSTCAFSIFNINNATTSGSAICSTTDTADVWFKIIKPVGVQNLKITTASSSPACQSVSGTSIEVFTACGGTSVGCSTTSIANPGFGELSLSRPCVAETLYIRVTADGDIGGKFNLCVINAGSVSGSGANCSNPNWICSIPYSQAGLTTAGFGADYDSANSACHDPFMNGEDYVFAYTPPANVCLRISLNSTGLNPGIFVFDGCPNLLATTHCIASAVNTTGNLLINSVSLLAGTTYYFLVDNDTLGSAPFNIPFNINITSVGTSQSYDACGATNLGTISNNQSCVFNTYTTECSTPSTIAYPTPTCGNFTNNITGDIWFTFTSGFNGNLLINTQPGSVNPSSDIAMAVYTGNCITLSLLACDDNSSGSSMPQISITVTSGTTYYIRAWTVNPGNTGSFDLCFTSACSPVNDLPCKAVLVNLGGSTNGNNLCAGSVSEPANSAQCVAGGTINTVWYKAVVPASGSIRVRTHTHSLIDTQIEGFTFPTGCGNAATSFSRKGCNDDGPDCGGSQGPQSYHDFSEQLFSGLTPGDTLFVAVDGFNSLSGDFEITFIDGTSTSFPPIYGADCDLAISVCGPTPITVDDPGILGYGNICDFSPSYDCWANGERNSAWYRVTVNPGTLQFDVQTLADYDFIMWDVTGISNACAMIQSQTLPSVRCNWVTTVAGHTGISIPDPNADWEPAITVAGGPRTYLIMIDNWNPPYQVLGYTINWMGSPISTTSTSSVIWQGAIDTSYAVTNNWGNPPCNFLPNCGIDAIVAATSTGRQPTISVNSSVNNLTINSGASLRIKSPFILDVCGNFTNNGSLICEPGSTVRFIGPGVQNINGLLTGANSFANLEINKAAGSVVLNANTDVSQNFTTINGTSIFNINGKYMKVGGHFTNSNGNSTFTGIASSTVEFNGSINQNFTNLNGVINLNRVTMNKPSAKLYLTGANSTMNVDSFLTLTKGIIVTRSISSLEVNIKYYFPTSSITGQNALSYIDGKLRRKISNGLFSSPPIPASYDFPVGDSLSPGGYEMANITFTTATLVNDLLATFSPWPSGPPNPGPVASECVIATYSVLPIFNHGFWTFKRSSTNVSGNYDISLHNTGFTNNTGLGWTVAKSDTLSNVSLSSSWRLLGSCVISSTPGNTQRTSINPTPGNDSTSFNHFYTTVQTNTAPLPVELLFFTAEPYGEKVLCKWETASETNNDYFDVEKSSNGTEFEKIGRVRGFGQGTSSESRKYSFIDPDLCLDIRYYRLKQVDIDGETSYSNDVAVNCREIKDKIVVYPNPANSAVTCSFYEYKSGTVRLQWIDLIGKTVKEELISVIKGYNTIQTDVSNIARGIYYMRIKENDKDSFENNRQIKFLKN